MAKVKKTKLEAQKKRTKERKEMQEHLDSVFVIVKPKAPDEKRFEDDFDKIFAWHTSGGEKELSETLKKQLDRWTFARGCFNDDAYYQNSEVANSLVTEYGISLQQAYKDIANCKRLYKYLEQADYEFEKVMHIERIKRYMRDAEKLKEKGLGILAKLAAELSKIYGFDKEKEQSAVPVDINIIAMDNPELVGGKRIKNLEAEIKGVLNKALVEKNDDDYTSFEEV